MCNVQHGRLSDPCNDTLVFKPVENIITELPTDNSFVALDTAAIAACIINAIAKRSTDDAPV